MTGFVATQLIMLVDVFQMRTTQLAGMSSVTYPALHFYLAHARISTSPVCKSEQRRGENRIFDIWIHVQRWLLIGGVLPYPHRWDGLAYVHFPSVRPPKSRAIQPTINNFPTGLIDRDVLDTVQLRRPVNMLVRRAVQDSQHQGE